MNFNISCEIYSKLASICSFFKPTTVAETREALSCVRLEYKKGNYYAVATNQEIASIYYLGKTDQADAVSHVTVDPVLVNQCREETQYGSLLEIVDIPEIFIGSAKTMLGYSYQGNACVYPVGTPLNDWQDWAPDKPVAVSRGNMFWDLLHIQSLVESSPSGKVYFPAFIDIDKPIVMRDIYEPNWVGLFIPKPDPGAREVKTEAKIPDWWKP